MILQFLSFCIVIFLVGFLGRATPLHQAKQWKHLIWMVLVSALTVIFGEPGWYHVGILSIAIWAVTAWEIDGALHRDPAQAWLFVPPLLLFLYRSIYLTVFNTLWYSLEIAMVAGLILCFLLSLRSGRTRFYEKTLAWFYLYFALVFFEEVFSYELIFNVFYGPFTGDTLLATVNFSVSYAATILSLIAATTLFFKGSFRFGPKKKPAVSDTTFAFSAWKGMGMAASISLVFAALHFLSPVLQPWILDGLLVGYPLFLLIWIFIKRAPAPKAAA